MNRGPQTRWRVALARAAACAVLCLLVVGAAVTPVSAQEKVQITDPYIELRTGPGRGYPVFFVAGRDEWIEILLRQTDWYKVRAANGQEGWVNRAQLETTLTEAGTAKVFRDVLVDDYLRRKLELGAAWGQFEGEPMLKIWTAYRFADALSVEAAIGQVQGTYSGTEFWNINLNVSRGRIARLSPFSASVWAASRTSEREPRQRGRDRCQPGQCGNALRYYIAERFVARLDLLDLPAYVGQQHARIRAWTIGIASS
jgi:hypothetical protein